MEIKKIDSSEKQLFWYVNVIFTETATKNRGLIIIRDSINDVIASIKSKPANLENCTQLKLFLEHKKAEIVYKGLCGSDVDEVVQEIDNMIETLKTGIVLGEKEQDYHSGGSQRYRNYDWFDEQHNWDPQTLEGYLKLHYQEFSVPTYTLSHFLKSGYFKHCLMHNWDARETAETFCRLYQKAV